jgi:hypothetical protein
MTEEQKVGLGVVIIAGAIVVGYLVSLVIPAKHFPRTAGLLSSNAVIGALAWGGVPVAGNLTLPFAYLSFFGVMCTVALDTGKNIW